MPELLQDLFYQELGHFARNEDGGVDKAELDTAMLRAMHRFWEWYRAAH